MKSKTKCILLDKLLGESWFDDEKEAQTWIMMRRVLVNDQLVYNCREKVSPDCVVRVKEYYKRKYTNKGGLKLEGALKDFNISVKDKIALDCGACTGGFTDCLLYQGAKKVYAVDAGHGQLAGKLRINENVVNMENTNISDEVLKNLDPKPEVITLDLSYLSLKNAVPVCLEILKNNGIIVCLVKPIFEVESSEIRRSGEINDPEILRGILYDLCEYFIHIGCDIIGITNSPVRGNNDTLEYFIGLSVGESGFETINSHFTEQIGVALTKSLNEVHFNKNNNMNY